MKKNEFEFVFVVLVYRNTADLSDFFRYFSLPCSKVIVVNSYYDDISESAFKELAYANGADFLSVPNKGYGAGNNRGCEFALAHYYFKYLVVSNADITIEQMGLQDLSGYENAIIAPRLINLRGREQNPHWPFRLSKIELTLLLKIYQHNWRLPLYFFFGLSRLRKECFLLLNRCFGRKRIFGAHGAFLIFSYSALQTLFPLFFEDIFLFCEEGDLAMKAWKSGVPVFYVPDIIIHHKEDGSVSKESFNLSRIEKESYLKFYNHWFGKTLPD